MVEALRRCGDELTRENVMRQAAGLKNFRIPMLVKGLLINTGPKDFAPMKSLQFQRFVGEHWEPFGDLMTYEK